MPAARARVPLALAFVLLGGALLRLQGIDWDAGQHLHPDERFLTSLAVDLGTPTSLSAYFDTAHSPLNPANKGREFFVYGTLPLFLTRALAAGLGLGGYGQVYLVGRALAAVFDLGTILLTFLIGRRLAHDTAALGAAALVACCVLSIQSAHFFTVDSFAACGAAATLLALVRLVADRRVMNHALFGLAFGLTLACRPNLLVLGFFYAAAMTLVWFTGRTRTRDLLLGAGVAVCVTTLVFRVLQPYAFQSGFWTLRLAPAFLESFREAAQYTSGAADFPPAVQWIGRTPLIFPARNLLVWGLGPAWGLATLFVLPVLARRQPAGENRQPRLSVWLLLSMAIGLFVFQGMQFTTTLRYLLPIVPVLALAVSIGLCQVATRRRLARGILVGVVAFTALWAVMFTAIYRRPNTRVAASAWMFDHLPAGSTIANEHWDDGLPLRLPGYRDDFTRRELTLYDDENEGKRHMLIESLVASDAIIISSNRLYGSIPRAPWRYPLARRYYELLFADALGFRLTRAFTSYPSLGGVTIRDDQAEESFTVYDHPAVLIFQKTPDFRREEVERLLGAVSFSGIVRVAPRDSSALYRRMRPADIPAPTGLARVAAVTAPDSIDGPTTQATQTAPGSLFLAGRWLLVLEALSLACFALMFTHMAGARDRGFALARMMAWLGPGTVVWLLASTGLAPAGPATARAVAGLLCVLGAAEGWRRRATLGQAWSEAWPAIRAMEAIWLGALLLFGTVHALNPAIYWGEKPMDFAILNGLLRSVHWPPPDPWFAGEALNYSYFGHALTAVFTQITGTPPAVAFNLAVITLAGLLGVMTFAVVYQVTGSRRPALAAVLLVLVAGNLAGVSTAVSGKLTRLGFDYFWSTSRIVPATVNEYPFWNLVFGDLHAHVMSMPLEMALLFVGAMWATRAARTRGERLWLSIASAWLVGAVAVTSAWSAPAGALVLAALMLTGGVDRRTPLASGVRTVLTGLAIALLAGVLFLPFWTHFTFPPRHLGRIVAEAATVDQVLTFFGGFVIVLLPALLVLFARSMRPARWTLAGLVPVVIVALAAAWWRSPTCGGFAAVALLGVLLWHAADRPSSRVAAVLVGAAGVLGVVTETVYVWDRLNTVFKYYLQIWLFMAPAVAILASEAQRAGGRLVRRAMATAVLLALVAGAFTSLTGLVGFVREPHASTPGFTLDGMAYLNTMSAGEGQAFQWLNQGVSGIPVILEAQGPFYGPFSRVSMNTGLPTILGWEYHLSQQGRDPQQLRARADLVRELFNTTDLARTELLLRQFSIDFVYVGPLERKTYTRAGLDKFAHVASLQPVFRNRDVTIYATLGRALSTKTWIDAAPPARPQLPVTAPLREPRGLARAPDGSLVIADFGNGRLQRIGADLAPVAAYGERGDRPGEFNDLCDVAVRPDGTMLVADTWNHRVQVLTPAGVPVDEWRADLFGPRGLALTREGDALVSDTGHHRIVRFGPDGRAREFVPPGQLDNPVGIAIDAEGLIYVADAGHRRVAVFDDNAQLVREWPVDGWRAGPRLEPSLAIAADGLVWATDPTGGRVLLFDRQGTGLGVAATQPVVEVPLGVEVAPDGSAIVTDGARPSPIVIQRPAGVPTLRVQTPTRNSPAR